MLKTLKSKKAAALLIIALALRIILMGLFSSDYQDKMFEPFVGNWLSGISDGVFNPYQYCYDNNINMDFPYPIVMLLVMSVGKLLCMIAPDAPLFIHNILFKLPLLAFDIIGCVYLVRMFPERREKCLWVYLFSPITLYATYMHGQLDIVPISLLFAALYYLSEKKNRIRFYLSALLTAAAVLAKLNIAAIVPLIFLYICKRYDLWNALKHLLCVVALTLGGFLVFWSSGFLNEVILTNEQNALFSLYLTYGNLKLFLSLFAIAIIYLYILNIRIINRELLLGFCGIIFAVFLALCSPMPGWYMWIVPFISAFVVSVDCRRDSVNCKFILEICYTVYFVFFHFREGICDLRFLNSDLSFLKIREDSLKNVFFTFLTGTLMYLVWLIYKFGISENGYYRFRNKSFVIGICGDSGTGKSTLQAIISEMFKGSDLIQIEGDGDHKWERGDDNWKSLTHLNPKANYLYRQAMDIENLKNGRAVKRVNYDHSLGKFTAAETIYAKKMISISGLHILYLPQLRDNVDLKIYMEADEELRVRWKISRDSDSRGYKIETVLKQINSRREDAEKYIIPQKEFADIIFCYFSDPDDEKRFGIRIMVSTQIDIEPIVTTLQGMNAELSYDFSEDFRYQIIEYLADEKPPEIDADEISVNIIDNLYEITEESLAGGNLCDIIQKLIILKAISIKMTGNG